MKRSTALFGLLTAAVFWTSSAQAQLVQASGRNSSTFAYVQDVVSGLTVPLFPTNPFWTAGAAADEPNRRLFLTNENSNDTTGPIPGFGDFGAVLYTWDYDSWDPNNAAANVAPTPLGRMFLDNPMDPADYSQPVNRVFGLGYDPVTGRLYGSKTLTGTGEAAGRGIYLIDTNPILDDSDPMNPVQRLRCTLLVAYPVSTYTFDGLDYNPADGYLYAVNTSTSNAGAGGYYRININAPMPVFEHIVNFFPFTGAFSGTALRDVNGLAASPTTLYAVIDETGQTGRIDLTAMPPVNITPLPFNNPWTSTGIRSGGAWAPGLFAFPGETNLELTSITTNIPEVVPPGGPLTYTVTVKNFGADQAVGPFVEMFLPFGASFVSASLPTTVIGPDQVDVQLPDLDVGDSVSFTFTINTPGVESPITMVATVQPGMGQSDTFFVNNTASRNTTVRELRCDIRLALSAPENCTMRAGVQATYTITLTNPNGPETAENVVLAVDLPTAANFISSSPMGTPVGNTLTLALPDLDVAASQTITIVLEPTTPDTLLTFSATVTTTTSQLPGDLADDAATSNSLVQPVGLPTTAAAVGILTTKTGVATNLLPDMTGTLSSISLFVMSSGNGNRWIMTGTSPELGVSNQGLLIVGHGDTWSLGARAGITMADGVTLNSFSGRGAINDDGTFATKATWVGGGGLDAFFIFDGTSWLPRIANEGVNIPASLNALLGGGTLWGIINQTNLSLGKQLQFFADITGLPTTSDHLLLAANGLSLIAREGFTVPTGQIAPAQTVASFDNSDTSLGVGFFMDQFGLTYSATGTLSGTSSQAQFGIVDGQIVTQAGAVFPGDASMSPVVAGQFRGLRMSKAGNALGYHARANTTSFAFANGTLFVNEGDEIAPGSGLFWANGKTLGEASFDGAFQFLAGNEQGDMALGGYVTGAGVTALNNRAVVVYTTSGPQVVLRENDPIDLDNNGLFDDGVHIQVFHKDTAFLSDDGWLYVIVRIRPTEAAYPVECNSTADPDSASLPNALIRVPVPFSPKVSRDLVPAMPDGSIDASDFAAMLSLIGTSSPVADFNRSGAVDLIDAMFFVMDLGKTTP